MASSSPFADLPRIKIPRSGGLNHLERILGLLQDNDPFCSSDALLVSMGLEVSRNERDELLQSQDDLPLIREYGIAILDTREISGRIDETSLRRLVLTRHYSTQSKPPTRECIFANTGQVKKQEKLHSIIAKSLLIKDDADKSSPSSATCFRNIAIVGHSVKRDLRILQRLGIDILNIAPRVVVLDTHNMGRDILRPTSTRLGGHAPITNFTLSAVLTELGCPYDEVELHNAGDDATYALFALLGLAVRNSQARSLNHTESARLEHLVRITTPAASISA